MRKSMFSLCIMLCSCGAPEAPDSVPGFCEWAQSPNEGASFLNETENCVRIVAPESRIFTVDQAPRCPDIELRCVVLQPGQRAFAYERRLEVSGPVEFEPEEIDCEDPSPCD